MPVRRPVDVPIRDESIRLGQFLKLPDLAETGSDAKERILAGEVLVNGEPETRRGRQLRVGDVVEFDGRPARVARRPGSAAFLAGHHERRQLPGHSHRTARLARRPSWSSVKPATGSDVRLLAPRADLASRYLELATNPNVSQLVTTLEPKGTGRRVKKI